MPDELQKYLYRREFGLSALEMENEPAPVFFLNMQIYGWIKKKEQIEMEHS